MKGQGRPLRKVAYSKGPSNLLKSYLKNVLERLTVSPHACPWPFWSYEPMTDELPQERCLWGHS